MGNTIYIYDDIEVDISRHQIKEGNVLIDLPDKIKGDKPWRFLEFLLEANSRAVSYDFFNDHSEIWKDDGGKAVDHRNSMKTWASGFNNVLKKRLIETKYGIGFLIPYSFKKTIEDENLLSSIPRYLTNNLPQFTRETSIIHRETEVSEIIESIANGECKISISGFGGIGKTSILRLLFWKIQENYEHVGWIEYKGDCKQSLLSDLEIYADIKDQEVRWSYILKTLKNDMSSKILFIDNVDSDDKENQNPLMDSDLYALCKIPNISIVLTSRLDELLGYESFRIRELGCILSDEKKIECCSDLFYSYYNKDELKKPSKKRQFSNEVLYLIELAQYHTYLIELLAKGAKYYSDLNEYIDLLKKNGISFPKAFFQTSYAESYTTVAIQIQKLFNLQTRTQEELKLLWDFAVLPNMVLTIDEVNDWLGYTEQHWTILKDQGWILFKDGLIMHPIVKESFRLNMKDGKAPAGTLNRIKSLTLEKHFISKNEIINSVLRKLSILESIIKYVDLDTELKADLLFEVGYYYFNCTKKLSKSEQFLQQALTVYGSAFKGESDTIKYKKAITLYWIGYVRSATFGKREMALDNLETSSKVFECLSNKDPLMCLYGLAQCYDHMGYVLTDYPKRYKESEEVLKKALLLWKSLTEVNSKDYSFEIATTEDNMGFLYTKWHKFDKAEKYYMKALKKREKLYAQDHTHSSELSWTLHNIGDLYMQSDSTIKKAEDFFCRALELRIEQNNHFKGIAEKNIAWTQVRLGLLCLKLGEIEKAEDLNESVKSLIDKYDADTMTFFIKDIKEQSDELSEKLQKCKAIFPKK